MFYSVRFFFSSRRRHTRCLSDWSSDVCSSDLPMPKVIVLTTFELDEYVYEALRAGASGFLLKNAPPEALLDAIRVVHAGRSEERRVGKECTSWSSHNQ